MKIKKTILTEGAGAGYTISSRNFYLKGKFLNVNVTKDEYSQTVTYDIECNLNGTVDKFSAVSYYNQTGIIEDLPVKCDRIIFTDFYTDEVLTEEELYNTVIGELQDAKYEYNYGAGWIHSTYDGTVTDLDNIQSNDSDYEIKANIILSYKREVEQIDKIIMGDNEANMKIYRNTNESIDTGETYWYYTPHGLGPGSIPKGVNILKTIETDNFGTYFLSDKLLTTSELREYEIKEKIPHKINNKKNIDEDMFDLLGIFEDTEDSVNLEDTDDDIDDLEMISSEWELIDSKEIPDSDGFTTQYALYKNIDGSKYITMFGDIDSTEPDEMYADVEFDSEKEAREFFDDYTGFEDEDSETSYYSDENEYKSDSFITCSKCGKKRFDTIINYCHNCGYEEE